MSRTVTLAVMVVLMSGCVKLEVKPGHVVSDSVNAGKDLYKTIKMKSGGEEERRYSYQVISESEQQDGEAINQCFSKLSSLASEASKKKPEIYDKQSEVKLVGAQREIRCSATALIKPKT